MSPEREKARLAEDELLVLNRWEEMLPALFESTGRWPKPLRVSLGTRVENHALDILEELVIARFQKEGRLDRLRALDLLLERLRRLLRLAQARGALSRDGFERWMRGINEIGKMLAGWRASLKSRE